MDKEIESRMTSNHTHTSAQKTEIKSTDSSFKIGVLRTSKSIKLPISASNTGNVIEYYLGDGLLDPASVARELFHGLRSLESTPGVGLILVEGVKEDHEGLAVMNRLRKAAGKIIVV